jgi:hypothetical protein
LDDDDDDDDENSNNDNTNINDDDNDSVPTLDTAQIDALSDDEDEDEDDDSERDDDDDANETTTSSSSTGTVGSNDDVLPVTNRTKTPKTSTMVQQKPKATTAKKSTKTKTKSIEKVPKKKTMTKTRKKQNQTAKGIKKNTSATASGGGKKNSYLLSFKRMVVKEAMSKARNIKPTARKYGIQSCQIRHWKNKYCTPDSNGIIPTFLPGRKRATGCGRKSTIPEHMIQILYDFYISRTYEEKRMVIPSILSEYCRTIDTDNVLVNVSNIALESRCQRLIDKWIKQTTTLVPLFSNNATTAATAITDDNATSPTGRGILIENNEPVSFAPTTTITTLPTTPIVTTTVTEAVDTEPLATIEHDPDYIAAGLGDVDNAPTVMQHDNTITDSTMFVPPQRSTVKKIRHHKIKPYFHDIVCFVDAKTGLVGTLSRAALIEAGLLTVTITPNDNDPNNHSHYENIAEASMGNNQRRPVLQLIKDRVYEFQNFELEPE